MCKWIVGSDTDFQATCFSFYLLFSSVYQIPSLKGFAFIALVIPLPGNVKVQKSEISGILGYRQNQRANPLDTLVLGLNSPGVEWEGDFS